MKRRQPPHLRYSQVCAHLICWCGLCHCELCAFHRVAIWLSKRENPQRRTP